MKALVTGAEGFVAPYLIAELVAKGYSVMGTYKDKPPSLSPQIKLSKLDILDKPRLAAILEDYSPDLLFHLAGITNVKFSLENPEFTMKVNVEGSRNIIEAAEEADKSPSIIMIGSAEEYGIPEFIPITEEHPLSPRTPYAESKMMAEKLAMDSAKRGFRVIIMRSFNHTGPGQSDDFVCPAFARQIAEIEKGKKPIIYVGNLKARRDFTHVKDVARAYVLAAEKGVSGEAYNVCSGKSYSIEEILGILLSLTKTKIEVRQDKGKMRASDIPVLEGSYKKLFKVSGWEPRISIEDTLKEILDWWRAKPGQKP